MGRNVRAVIADEVLQLELDDPAPAYVQLERRVRMAIADGTLEPGDRLPSVPPVSQPVAPGAEYGWARVRRPGARRRHRGQGRRRLRIAPHESLDRTALSLSRQERLRTLARQVAVRGLSLGFEPTEIIGAVGAELAARGRPVADLTAARTPLGPDEAPLLSTRNRLRGTVAALRVGEMLAEVTIAVSDGSTIVAAITRQSLDRLSLSEGSNVAGYVKATEIVLVRADAAPSTAGRNSAGVTPRRGTSRRIYRRGSKGRSFARSG